MTETQKPKRWVKPVLIASLAVNFLIGGAVIGAMVLGGGHRGKPSDFGRGGIAMLPFLSELETDHKKELRKSYRKGHDSFRADRKMNKAIQATIIDSIKAQPFDRAALEAAFEQLRNAPKKSTEVGHNMLIETIAGMSDEERAEYVDRIVERLQKRGKRTKR